MAMGIYLASRQNSNAPYQLVDGTQAITANQFSQSVEIQLQPAADSGGSQISGPKASGEILHINLYSVDGAEVKPDGVVLFFHTDPAIASNDVSITIAEWKTVFASVAVAAADWSGGSTQLGSIVTKQVGIGFHPLSSIYVAWLTGTQAIATDDELFIDIAYRRDL